MPLVIVGSGLPCTYPQRHTGRQTGVYTHTQVGMPSCRVDVSWPVGKCAHTGVVKQFPLVLSL